VDACGRKRERLYLQASMMSRILSHACEIRVKAGAVSIEEL
jgi:hypothetical protein